MAELHQVPVSLALVLCEHAWQDPSGRWFILGTFKCLAARGFPARVASIAVYTALTGGQGEQALRLVLRDADGTAVGETTVSVTFPNPAATVEGAFNLQQVMFPAAGPYSLSLYAGDHFLAERRLEIVPAPWAPGP